MLFLHDGLKRGKNKIFVQGTLVMTDDCINQMTMQFASGMCSCVLLTIVYNVIIKIILILLRSTGTAWDNPGMCKGNS